MLVNKDGKEISLVSVLIFHQLLLEGFKLNSANKFNIITQELDTRYRIVLSKIDKTEFSEFTQIDVTKLKRELIKVNNDIYKNYEKSLTILTDSLSTLEIRFLEKIYGLVADTDIKSNVDLVKKKVQTTPNGATGSTIAASIAAFLNYNNVKMVENINYHYANKSTVALFRKSIFGTATANQKNGLLSSMFTSNRTLLNTLLQHIASIVNLNTLGAIAKKYVWDSVIDNRTTEICRFRNQRIYEYGKGPVPPAHPNCRSMIRPITVSSFHNKDMTLLAWLKAQNKDVLSLIYTPASVEKIMATGAALNAAVKTGGGASAASAAARAAAKADGVSDILLKALSFSELRAALDKYKELE